MQEKRNITLLISLTILIIVTTVVFYLRQDKPKDIIDPLTFRVEDASRIDHVILQSKKETINLTFNGNTWKIDEKYEADPQLIKVLMATLLQVTPKRPVALQLRDSINKRLETAGIDVKLFEGAAVVKEFLAGGNDSKTEAYFRDIKSGETYLITIPGYRVYSSGIFEVTAGDWREKRIFNFNWRNFRSVTLHYPKDPASDFEVARQKDFLGVVGLENPDSTRLNNFLNDMLTLTADKIVVPGTSRVYDSMAKTAPAVDITVTDIAKRSYHLEIFTPVAGSPTIVGRSLDNDIVLFDRRKTFPVLKKRGYFSAKPVR